MRQRAGHPREIDHRLRDLWSRRAMLSRPEWGELYTIVTSVLARSCTDLVAQLPGSREEFIQDFFVDKVLSLGDQGNEIYHAGALVVFYRRYLQGRLRDPYLNAVLGTPITDADDGGGLIPLEKALNAKSIDEESGDDRATVRQLTDWLAAELGGVLAGADLGLDASDNLALIRRYTGLNLEHAAGAALAFLQGRDDWSHLAGDSWWIRLYLRCHFCPDTPGAMALSTLARKHWIPSYHYKAVALGVTVPKHHDAALESFRRSHRGQWLAKLGIPVDPEHLLEMSLGLKVLCLVALKSQDPC